MERINYYVCSFCRKVFDNEEIWQKHEAECQMRPSQRKCYVCKGSGMMRGYVSYLNKQQCCRCGGSGWIEDGK